MDTQNAIVEQVAANEIATPSASEQAVPTQEQIEFQQNMAFAFDEPFTPPTPPEETPLTNEAAPIIPAQEPQIQSDWVKELGFDTIDAISEILYAITKSK